MKDYYAILGVPENAGEDAIKKAFRRLALKYHPDKNPDNQKWAEEKFKEINEAFSVIGDNNRRREYDLRRKSPFAASGNYSYNQQDIFRTSFSNPNYYDQLNRLFNEMGLRFDQDFVNRSFFNGQGFHYADTGQGPAGAGNVRGAQFYMPLMKLPRGLGWMGRVLGWLLKKSLKYGIGIDTARLDPDIHRNISISKKEAAGGGSKKISYQRNGKKKTLVVKIPLGVKTGMKIRLNGMGKEGYRKGDLYLHVKVRGG